MIDTANQPVAVGAGDEVPVTIAGNFADDRWGNEHNGSFVWVGVLRCGVGKSGGVGMWWRRVKNGSARPAGVRRSRYG